MSDGNPVSTPDLIRAVALALGKKARLLPFPVWALKLGGTLTARGPMIDRLVGSLVVDDSLIRERLQWKAPFSFEQGLKETVSGYRAVPL